MYKLSFYPGEGEHGQVVFPLFGPGDSTFEKVAAPLILPEVQRFIATLRPNPDIQYVLVNAMGASEYYGSNVNGDWFGEAALIHKPDGWTGVPALDRSLAKDWPYGFPTFYNAHAFAHHKNKNPATSYGDVLYTGWNDGMKRVELVIAVSRVKCERHGGVAVWDKLSSGNHVDVSMGTRVPFDLCSLCTDWDEYNKALRTFVPGKHKHPDEAVLQYHKLVRPIRGLSITRRDYCSHALREMNRIYPDGRKVFVYNTSPRFFDISFVFIGADKTAKVMFFLNKVLSADLAAALGMKEPEEKAASAGMTKAASVFDKLAILGKQARKDKQGEIVKQVPAQFAPSAIPVLTRHEKDIPKDVLDSMAAMPLRDSLGTAASMGIILRPREFQRITLVFGGHGDLADKLEESGSLFPASNEHAPMGLGLGRFSSVLARLLAPLMSGRSALGPHVENRVLHTHHPEKDISKPSSHPEERLRKIGSAYNSYRDEVMSMLANGLNNYKSAGAEFDKLASMSLDDLFTPLTAAYVQDAFLDELPGAGEKVETVLSTGG